MRKPAPRVRHRGRQSVVVFGCGPFRHLKQLQADPGGTALVEAQILGYGIRDVQLAALHIGATVVDADDLAAMVPGIRYPDDRPKRKRWVCRRVAIHIIGFTGCSRQTVKVVSVPARDAFPDSYWLLFTLRDRDLRLKRRGDRRRHRKAR